MNNKHTVEVDFTGFKNLLIWTKPGAEYLSIEPWNGLPDYLGFDKTIENKKDIIERANKLLKDLELYEHKDKYPSEVSGGMQQRVAIARSIINNPKVIFGDEPTGALNSSTGKVVLDMLSEINDKGQSIVMVTHDIKTALRANRILYIKDGRIDGELNLGKYTEENARERRERVQEFLEEKSW